MAERKRKTPAERLAELQEKEAALKASIQRVKAKMTNEDRRKDTRRKVLAGALVLALVDAGKIKPEFWQAELDQFLQRDHDRSLFDLPPRP